MVLLSAVAAMGAAQAFGQQHGLQRLVPVVCLLVAAGLGVWAVRRYLFHLGIAEALLWRTRPSARTAAPGSLSG